MALVGAGGKTSSMITLVDELLRAGRRVLVSTTTRAGRDIGRAVFILDGRDGPVEQRLAGELSRRGAVFLSSGPLPDGKISGASPERLNRLAHLGIADVILVEADGARQRSLKVPADHEPIIPSAADLVCPMVGLDSLGRTIDSAWVHRPELVRQFARGDTVTAELIVRIVTSRRGGLRGVPHGALVRPILNKVTAGQEELACAMAASILAEAPEEIDRVAVCDVRSRKFGALTREPRAPALRATGEPPRTERG